MALAVALRFGDCRLDLSARRLFRGSREVHASPKAFELLFQEPDESEVRPSGPDPITERILTGSRMDRSLYVMLTALIQSGEPKLLRAAEMSLKSLVKQSKQSTVPWQNRPSGHFDMRWNLRRQHRPATGHHLQRWKPESFV